MVTGSTTKPTSQLGEPEGAPGALPGLLRYTFRRGLVILITILIGVYLTVVIANKGGQIDVKVYQQEVEPHVRPLRWTDEDPATIDQLEWELEEQAGLHLPTAWRNLRWTYRALRFDWGKADYRGTPALFRRYGDLKDVNEMVAQHFPNTLLLIGAADLIIFLFGIPLALNLASRKHGHWLDRIITMFSPLSSVPSWVHGIILVTIFAAGLRVLPFGGKYDIMPAETTLDQIAIVVKHMILPVTAILFGMFFQLVYSWRTFFLIYSSEDYVDLAEAKGLAPRTVERRYILRPTMPYLLTSFAMTLVGFWQMTTALEFFFNWPGLGMLYVNSLPNFWGEHMFPGEMGVVLSIVVIFAYLLGVVVFVLDVAYAWLDPRVRLRTDGRDVRLAGSKARWRFRLRPRRKAQEIAPLPWATVSRTAPKRTRTILLEWIKALQRGFHGLKTVFQEIAHYPSAMFGLFILTVFVGGSLYAVIALPYGQIGSKWHSSTLTSRVYASKSVPPVWINWFRKNDLPETRVLGSQDGDISKVERTLDAGTGEINFTATFDYAHIDFPQDVVLYIDATFPEKRPHLYITWVTPDGRVLEPKSPFIESKITYSFSEHINLRLFMRQNEHWQKWVVADGANRTPGFHLLFADPTADEPVVLPGTYQLRISALTFEEDTDVDVELVLFGRVSGWAGTDYLRRDLVVPLLWGLPLTLAFGVMGAVLTTILAMIIAAVGVWFGGWTDNLIQRLTEANMILPILAVGILVFALYAVSIWVILVLIVLANVFGSPTKAFRAALLQVKEAPYIESARAYGSSNARIIFQYMIPRIIPVLIPQLVTLVPSLVFLEATLAIFNVFDPRYPTWGRVIYEALSQGSLWAGSQYWVLEPISLLLLTGLAFALLGFALERILNPRLQEG